MTPSQGNGARKLARGKQSAGQPPPPLNRAVDTHKSARENPPSGGRTGVETTHGGHQPRRVANQNFVNSHTTVNSRAACPVKMLQPAAAPRDSPSGSSCAARRYKYHARPSLSDRCKHGSKSPPPAPISRDARMLSTVKSSDNSHSRFSIIRASPCGADGGADGAAAAVEPGMVFAGDMLVD